MNALISSVTKFQVTTIEKCFSSRNNMQDFYDLKFHSLSTNITLFLAIVFEAYEVYIKQKV